MAVLVAVIGPGDCDDETAVLARAVGEEIAQRGAVLVCGGRGGVMEAACRGARSAGGLTVGILPGTDRRQANQYVDVPIATGIGEARNAIVVGSAETVIAIGGSYGTLSEIGLALRMGRPVVGLDTWEIGQGGRPLTAIARAPGPREAVELALDLAARRLEGEKNG